MAQFVNIFNVDLQAGKPNLFPLNCNAGEGDANGFRVGARVTDGGEYIALGGSCVGKVVRADGATVQLTGTISGNVAYVVLDQQSCAVEGPLQVAVCWVSGSNVTTLLVAYGTVVNTQTGSAIQPSTPLPDLTELLAEIDEMRAATAAAEALLDTALKYNHVSQASAESDYAKLAANLPGNTFSFVSGSWFTDLPGGTYWIFTIADKENYTSFAGQYIYMADTGRMWTRRRDYISGSWAWTNWVLKDDPENTPLWRGVLVSNTDLNSITALGMYGISDSNTYTNKPELMVSGYLFTVVFGLGFVTQILLSLDGNAVYTRRKNSSNVWSAWSSGVHNVSAKYYAFGDSTTLGQIGGGSGNSKYNYPACVGKLLHMQVYNMAVGGQGLIKDWDYIHTNYINNLDMTGAKLVTIGWAYNDGHNLDFGDYTDTEDTTFIGKYYTIMKEFQQKCPDAKLILVTGYGSPDDGQIGPPVVKPTLQHQFTFVNHFTDKNVTTGEIYDELEKMCHLHGWSCVNQAKGTVFNEFNASVLIGDNIHPTNDGYLLYGNHIGARIAAMYGNIAAWL